VVKSFLLIGSLTTRVTYCFGWNEYSILVNSEMITFCFAIMFSHCFMTKAIHSWPPSSSQSFLTVYTMRWITKQHQSNTNVSW
jgi:hypothetical protein